MPKNIIFCSDGTWNHPKDAPAKPLQHQQKLDTNVAKLAGYPGLPGIMASSPSQVVIYDDGVGVEFPMFLGGAFGVGLFGKITQGYAQIAEQYESGDRIFLFGFSRGAYTARSLAGMLSLIGLPTKLPAGDRKSTAKEAAEKAFLAYSTPIERDKMRADLTAKYALEIPTIAMQGMWDTVGGTGFSGAIFGVVDPVVYGFLNTDLHPNTKAAYHAMSIDEHRGEFVLTPWPGKAMDEQILKQVWFAGVHSEVGGSAEAVGLSDITLAWMMTHAEACGAELSTAAAAPYRAVDPANSLVFSKDSFSPLWVISRRRSIPSGATIANSVAIRLKMDGTYRPTNLSLDANGALDPGYTVEPVVGPLAIGLGVVIPSNVHQFDTGIDVVAGKQYHFIANGQWIDKNPPAVTADGVANPGGIRDHLDALKRVPAAPWMALLGRIDHGDWFLMGADCTLNVPTGGRLFCCANDAPGFYGNNQGSVTLLVSANPTS